MRTLALAALLTLAGSTAAADDIAPPPAECPRGAVGTSEHAGEWCAATTCATDADCTRDGLRRQGVHQHEPGPLVCGDAALCVTEEEYTLGGLWPDQPPRGVRRIGRACVGDACPTGGACETARRCVPPGAEPPPAPRTAPAPPPASSSAPPRPREDGGGRGCAASPARGRGAVAALAFFAAIAQGLRSRRDRGIHARCAATSLPSSRSSS